MPHPVELGCIHWPHQRPTSKHFMNSHSQLLEYFIKRQTGKQTNNHATHKQAELTWWLVNTEMVCQPADTSQ